MRFRFERADPFRYLLNRHSPLHACVVSALILVGPRVRERHGLRAGGEVPDARGCPLRRERDVVRSRSGVVPRHRPALRDRDRRRREGERLVTIAVVRRLHRHVR